MAHMNKFSLFCRPMFFLPVLASFPLSFLLSFKLLFLFQTDLNYCFIFVFLMLFSLFISNGYGIIAILIISIINKARKLILTGVCYFLTLLPLGIMVFGVLEKSWPMIYSFCILGGVILLIFVYHNHIITNVE